MKTIQERSAEALANYANELYKAKKQYDRVFGVLVFFTVVLCSVCIMATVVLA